MAIVKNLTIDQGSTFSVKITLVAAGNNYEAYNLTGYGEPTAQIRKTASSSTVTAAMTCSVPQPMLGEVYMMLTDEQTALIKPGRYMYDLVVISGEGEKYRAVEGIITVTAGVTR